ncbi:MAG TPA: efflux RND transporter periplasmic adaptor subunit, partial [Candidatus Ozemobacteraceae bacterium]|nr:efflux RND transporter periplasmic adaptor subunit [Candidatus Ozemobacteraceae bacterium]
DAGRNLKRVTELHQRKLVSQADLDSAQTAVDSAAAAVDAAEAQVKATLSKEESVKAQIQAVTAQHEGSLAQIEQMTAQLNVAKINLERTRIYSPVDGVVISRNVDVGQTVAASLQAPTLFTIANDLRQMQINTAVDEADIGKVREGQKVFFTVDAYRGREFVGTVGQVRLSPTVTSNVVTYSVMVNVENTDLSLKPGMTASVEILVDEKVNVLRIPARAQFFRMPDEFLAKVASDPAREDKPDVTRIWVLKHHRPEPRDVVIGLSTSQLAEVVGGDLGVGERVIIDTRKPGEAATTNGGNSSGMRSGMRDYRRMSRGR